MKKQYISVVIATIAGIAMVAPVFAEESNTSNRFWGMMKINHQENDDRGDKNRGMMGKPSAVGVVTSINGGIITISGTASVLNPSAVKTTFTVDTTNAKIIKNNATSTITGILVGDTIAVQGAITGTNIVATLIRDGNFARGNEKAIYNHKDDNKNVMAQLQGNGQPVIAGNVTTVGSTTFTLSNKSNVTYTVDATNAKVVLRNGTSTLSAMTIGDTVMVQGTVNGTSIIASTVIDSGMSGNATSTQNTNRKGLFAPKGFFGGVGSFFSHLFGF